MPHTSRLAAVIGAGPFRLAVPATDVREVVRIEAGARAIQDQAVIDLARLLDGPPSVTTWALRLALADSPALGVETVEGILELGGTLPFRLPAVLGSRPAEVLDGAVTVAGRLALELRCQALLASADRPVGPTAPWPIDFAAEPAERALVVVVAGRCLGFSLPYVLSVMAAPVVSAVPRVPLGQRGVVVHEQTLCPVLDVGEVLFERPTPGAFGVVVDMAGTTWVVLADAVLGVRSNFKPVAGDQPGWMESARGERALFLVFPSDAGGLKGAGST